ncbi:Gfo/Idh/MocA family oxidoreductase [Frigoribacterium faeni]|uniref:Gfo/Idh/MocA family protein n=1 Tax=Frigoribacterium faeni TaxID=145483 RepID=UPI001FAC28CE|nr:Gfo/Idh/MocA family oxidoreductase [Frigoribacterium faeni]MCJ0699811.1 Gfo/Idh/MocA family oxidoreductase [Frigoribacterium faeni]
MTIRWGILGAGGIAQAFTSDLLGAGLAVSAVGSRDQAKADEFAGRFGIDHAHGSYEDLVADPTVDAVYVATPHVFHAEQALLAIAAGKHVLVEKAFTVNAAEAQTVLDAASAAGVVAMEAMWTRYLPQSARLRAIVRSGTIGEVRLLTAVHLQSLPTDPRHRLNDPALGGGALLDLGVYPVSFAHDLLGAPTDIATVGVLSDQGVDARHSVTLGYASGASAQLYSALDSTGHNVAVVHGTAGRVEIDATWYTPVGFTVYDSDDAVIERFDSDVGSLRGMHHQAIELDRVVSAGETESPLLTAEGIVDVMRTMDEMRKQIGVRYPGE